jgi:hypothetical protein
MLMKPNDDNGKLPAAQRPFRVLIIAGSNRRQYNCPGVDSKARTLMLRMAEQLPQDWEIDYEDLGNVFASTRYQACNVHQAETSSQVAGAAVAGQCRYRVHLVAVSPLSGTVMVGVVIRRGL